jgi:hypothetical protein
MKLTPCRQSPHVATDTYNVATSTISSIQYLLMFLRKTYLLPKNERLNSFIEKYLAHFNKIGGDVWSKNVCHCMHFLFFSQSGDNDTSVATNVATLVITLDITVVKRHSSIRFLWIKIKATIKY